MVLPMKTLLVPIDFSDATRVVIEESRTLAQDLPARLILIHVVELVAAYLPVGAAMEVMAAVPPPPDTSESLAAQEQKLEALAGPLRAAGLTADIQVLAGMAVDDIIDQAGKTGADYIILGSHGHGALYHLLSGSVVTGVLRRAPCPVLVVPAVKSESA